MILSVHIVIAVFSIIVTTFAYIRPSSVMLRASYALAGATLATGTILVVLAPAHMMQACLSGVAYLAVVSIGIITARSRFSRLQTVAVSNK